MYRFGTPERSWWEASAGEGTLPFEPLAGASRCEVAIIGGGYTGLSTAYHLARDHDVDARVLEAGHIGWGASGRNGGFCCVGADGLGGETLAKTFGEPAARDFYRSQVEAVQLVRDLIADEGIDAEMFGEDEVAIACSPKGFERLKRHAEFQFRRLGLDSRVIGPDEVRATCFDSPVQHGAAVFRPTFGLHPLKFVRGLATAAGRHGARIHPHSEVVAWQKDGTDHLLRTAGGGELRARQVVLTTNGFMPEHLHARFEGRSLPMISAIVVTRPLSGEERERHGWQTRSPSYTAVNLLNYFRLLPDGRLLFGGRGSANGAEDSAERNYDSLVARLHEVFPRWRDVDVDYRWHGLVCMTRRLTPAIGRLDDDPSVAFAFGYHGNGVSTATWAGMQLASWIGTASAGASRRPERLPAVVHGLPGRFPLARFRLAWIRGVIASLRLADRFG